MRLRVLDGAFAVCRLAPDAALPAPTPGAALWSVTRTADELSLVVPEADAPPGARADGGWRALVVAGPLDLALTGILARLAGALAGAGVPVFALATFDTDYVLVPGARLDDAVTALRTAGCLVDG